ncbi:MAG: hypothetical protein OS130_10040 [Thermodesulfobacteriota bacterium]|jgi:Flp pilus assembly protein TadB|nr:MAG: hypothetical protein OS130_10040 [Thermodesulfobacteriota bacterium]
MTPEQITAVTLLLKVLEMMSSWHFGAIVLFIIVLILGGPYLWMAINSTRQDRQFETQKRQFEAMVTMYKNNAALVDKNEKLTKDYEGHLGEFKDIVMMNTQAFTQLTAAIEQNQFCPMVRIENQKIKRVPE